MFWTCSVSRSLSSVHHINKKLKKKHTKSTSKVSDFVNFEKSNDYEEFGKWTHKTNWYGNQGEINSPFVETTESFEYYLPF